MFVKKIILLRGVMPTGKNRIPKMSYLVEILEYEGFRNVQTYIQSGNVVLETDMSDSEISKKVHDIILEKIGADLSVIVKNNSDLKISIEENSFDENYDFSRIHLVFTNDSVDREKLERVKNTNFLGEVFKTGDRCLYMYLPRDAEKKRLNNNYLEKQLGN